jgi:hypothetical protein
MNFEKRYTRTKVGIILRLPRRQAGNNVLVPYHHVTLLLMLCGIDSDNSVEIAIAFSFALCRRRYCSDNCTDS